MPNHVITIKNCNNIREAHVSLLEGTLNIKFGYNGTGKSTISEAIVEREMEVKAVQL